MIHFGLIGFGYWGKIVSKCIQGRPDITRLSCVLSKHLKFPSQQIEGVALYHDLNSFLNHSPLDAVFIASSPENHESDALAVIQRKLPFIIEKPIALNTSSAQKIIGNAQNDKIPFIVNTIHLFNPAFRELLQRVSNISPAKTTVTATSGNNGPRRSTYSALWDYGPHDLSMIFSIFKSPPSRINIRNIAPDHGLYEFELEFDTQGSASVSISNQRATKVRQFVLEKGSHRFILDDGNAEKLREINLKTHLETPISYENKTPMDILLENFCDGISGKRSLDLTTSTQAMLITETLEQIEQLSRKQMSSV